jgi:hypothetical protein
MESIQHFLSVPDAVHSETIDPLLSSIHGAVKDVDQEISIIQLAKFKFAQKVILNYLVCY